MKKILQQQASTIAYTAGAAATPFKIGSQSWWMTALLFGFELAKTGANTTATVDYLPRIITNLQIVGGGNPYLVNGAPDTRLLYWDWRLRSQGRGRRMPDMPTGTQTIYYLLPWIPGVSPIHAPTGQPDFFDVSAPVRTDTDLTVNLTWAANSVIATGTNTIATTTVIRLTAAGVVLETGDPVPVFKPLWNTLQIIPSATSTGLGTIQKLDTGFWYRRSLLYPTVGAANVDNRTNGFSSTAISEVGLKTKDGRYPVSMKTWDASKMSCIGAFDVSEDNVDVPGATVVGGASVTTSGGQPGGVVMWDYTRLLKTQDNVNPNNPALADPNFGANLVSKNDGTLAYAFTVDTTTNVIMSILQERYGKYARVERDIADLGDRFGHGHRHHRTVRQAVRRSPIGI